MKDKDIEKIDKIITASVHPIIFAAIQTFKQDTHKLGEFQEFVHDWISLERKEAQKELLNNYYENPQDIPLKLKLLVSELIDKEKE